MVRIEVIVADQELMLYKNEQLFKVYSVATALKGVGEQYGSFQTPRGRHSIRAKIGGNEPVNTVFVRRRPTGELYSQAMAQQHPPERDWILTRILWLCGQEPGKNR